MQNKILSLIVIVLLFVQCKPSENFEFRMSYFHEFKVDPTYNTFDTHYFTFTNASTNVDNFLAPSGSEKVDITAIKSTVGRLSSILGAANLIFVEDVEIGFYTDNPDDPADFQLAFYRDNIQSTRNGDVDLLPSLVNLTPILSQDFYNVCVKLKFFNSPPEFLDIRLNMEFGVETL